MEAARGGELLDLLIVGAGLSGIGAACHLQRECPDKRYAIVEARETIGGTWDLFRYPGVRSDSDMYTLGYAFKPWRAAQAIADGPSIRDYIAETAAEHLAVVARLDREGQGHGGQALRELAHGAELLGFTLGAALAEVLNPLLVAPGHRHGQSLGNEKIAGVSGGDRDVVGLAAQAYDVLDEDDFGFRHKWMRLKVGRYGKIRTGHHPPRGEDRRHRNPRRQREPQRTRARSGRRTADRWSDALRRVRPKTGSSP